MRELDIQSGVTKGQIYVVAVSAAAQLVDFLDFFLIGFVLAYIAKPWNLTVMESTIILLTSGIGAVLGSFVCGSLSDRFGRRPVMLITILMFALCTLALALTPDGSWIYVAVLRFFVGFGTTGIYSSNIPLLQEFMPSKRRGLMTGIVATFVPVGILCGSGLVYLLGDVIGWRGLFIVGAIPAIPLLLAAWFIPESPLWLKNHGRMTESRRSIAWALGVPEESVKLEPRLAEQPSAPKLKELAAYPRALFVSWGSVLGSQAAYYGVTLWAPVLLVLLLGVSPSHAAFLLIFCNLGDIVGRITFAYISDRVGRRFVGICQGFLGAGLLVAAAYSAQVFVLGEVSLFWLLLILCYFVISGAFSVTVPYAAEVWPARLRASGLGSAYGVGSLGKIFGPLGLGLLLGSSNALAPQASLDAVGPAFTYLAAWLLLTGVIFLFFAVETKGQSLDVTPMPSK